MKCWMLSTPRTGGNYLSIILNQIQDFDRVCGSYAFEEWLSIQSIYRTNNKINIDEFFKNPPACINMHWHKALNEFGKVDKIFIKGFIKNNKFIILKRRDILDQVVSYYIAKMTGKTRIYQGEEEEYLKRDIKINDQVLLDVYDKVFPYKDAWKDFENDVDAIHVFYEDVLNHGEHTISGILDWLNIKNVNIKNIIELANIKYKKVKRIETKIVKERLIYLLSRPRLKVFL